MKDVKESRVAAVILAAGKSSRMGKTKQVLRLGDKTVLGQTIAMVQHSAAWEIVLVLGACAVEIIPQLAGFEGLKVIVNRSYDEGMASSLRAGLSALHPKSDAALIVLGDQPFIRSETLDRLAGAHRHVTGSMLTPTYKGTRGNPVLLDRSIFPEVMALEGDVGCRALFRDHPDDIEKVEVEDPGILLDINNPDDYEQVRTLGEFPDAETVANVMAERVGTFPVR